MIAMIRAKRGCRFGGKNYSAGEIVPESAVDKKSIGALVMMKIIELVPDKPAPKPKAKVKTDDVDGVKNPC